MQTDLDLLASARDEEDLRAYSNVSLQPGPACMPDSEKQKKAPSHPNGQLLDYRHVPVENLPIVFREVGFDQFAL